MKTMLFVLGFALGAAAADAAWAPGSRFSVQPVNGKPCLVAPDGAPFKSVGIVWAYGPERGPAHGPLTVERLTNELARMQALGFNTLNLYGDRLIPEMLAWCDEHEFAVYFRTSYYNLPDFPSDLKQYPDFMDPAFRAMARAHYRRFLEEIEGHPSVLAIDMDHRWLFPLDWAGKRRFDQPMLRPHGLAAFPAWLAERYGTVAALNAAWGTTYGAFGDVVKDETLVRNGAIRPLGLHPARVDVYRFTLWTAQDFLRELCAGLREDAPGVLITPTTEHPECIPEVNPPVAEGVSFMSPVHYNSIEDYDCDPVSLCKLIYETRWHYDLQGGPVYISETGWRTDTLEQRPPSTSYAFTKPADEETAARFYAVQSALLNVLPWIGGYGYFKLYDKVPEGDFGYLRDDGTKKPMAIVGDAVNRALTAADLADPEPEVWIFYPDYAQASQRPGFVQLKTWVYVWERPFLDALDAAAARHWPGLRAGDRAAGAAFAADVRAAFREKWRPFAFTTTVPDDDKPVLLFSTVAEILAPEDRARLLRKNTVSFGCVGWRDPAMRETTPWHHDALGLAADAAAPRLTILPLASATQAVAEAIPLRSPADLAAHLASAKLDAMPCSGQTLTAPTGSFSELILLASARGGNAAPSLRLEYDDDLVEERALGPTISDGRHAPTLTPGHRSGGTHLSELRVPIQPHRRLRAVHLPEAAEIDIHFAGLAGGGPTQAVVRLAAADGTVLEGESPWLAGLAEVPGADILRTFANGAPAVARRGSHVVFLYDPLTWVGDRKGIGRHAAFNERLLAELLNHEEKHEGD